MAGKKAAETPGMVTGYYYNSETYCSITINGGNITATGGYAGGGGGAGVGAGYLGYTGTITINGGDVIASSDRYESGVGMTRPQR